MGGGECPNDRLLVFYQKIPHWLIKITFLGRAETAIRSSIISRFGIMDVSTSDVILASGFYSLIPAATRSRKSNNRDRLTSLNITTCSWIIKDSIRCSCYNQSVNEYCNLKESHPIFIDNVQVADFCYKLNDTK